MGGAGGIEGTPSESATVRYIYLAAYVRFEPVGVSRKISSASVTKSSGRGGFDIL